MFQFTAEARKINRQKQSSFHQMNIMMMNRFPFSGIINAKG